MSKLYLLYSIFILSAVFLLIPYSEPSNWFLFADQKLSFASHLYFISEHLTVIILAHVIRAEAKQYTEALNIFFYILVADLIDYLLTYNGVWFEVGSFPVSMNITKAVIFGLVILREVWKKS